jgi:hypothetical protein
MAALRIQTPNNTSVQLRPVQKRQQESYDRTLKCITHLIYMLVETARTDQQKEQMRKIVTDIIRSNPRSASTGDTLLHLCVSRLNTIKSSYIADDNQVSQKICSFSILLNLHFPLHCVLSFIPKLK